MASARLSEPQNTGQRATRGRQITQQSLKLSSVDSKPPRKAYFKAYYKAHPDSYRDACPDCEGLKAKKSRRCEACRRSLGLSGRQPKPGGRVATETPEVRERRLERYREYKARTGRTGYPTNTCPDCGKPKWVKAKRCKKCSYKVGWSRTPVSKRVAVQLKNPPDCLYCGAEMRSLEWHSKLFWRCPGCGLETTPLEISRIAYEGSLAA
jgi:predicted RNA-binding Zn-ribbon protein involved in translation (DUF1610 family)